MAWPSEAAWQVEREDSHAVRAWADVPYLPDERNPFDVRHAPHDEDVSARHRFGADHSKSKWHLHTSSRGTTALQHRKIPRMDRNQAVPDLIRRLQHGEE
jgi:hypothetical protein